MDQLLYQYITAARRAGAIFSIIAAIDKEIAMLAYELSQHFIFSRDLLRDFFIYRNMSGQQLQFRKRNMIFQ